MTEPTKARPPRCALRLEEVCKILGCRPSKLYEDIKTGVVPAPFKISTRAVRWDSDEVYDALDTIQRAGKEAWLNESRVGRPPVNPNLRSITNTVIAENVTLPMGFGMTGGTNG